MLAIAVLLSFILFGAMQGEQSTRFRSNNTIDFGKKHHIQEGYGPSYFIIGAPKCATTSLYKLFTAKHPGICSSIVKEVHYFDRKGNWDKGAAFYSAHFSTNKQHCGKTINGSNTKNMPFIDSTPDYFANRAVPARIYASFTKKDRHKKKFILVLREPVAREYSWYNHRARFCTSYMRDYILSHRNKRITNSNGESVWDTNKLCADKHCKPVDCANHAAKAQLHKEVQAIASFSEYYESGNLVCNKSVYIDHLEHWLQYFHRRQFFIVNLATLLENTTDTVQRMTHFMGLPPFELAEGKQIVLPHDNAARVETHFDCAVRHALYPYYEPHNERLYDYLERTANVTEITHEPPFPKFIPQLCSPGQKD